MECYVVCPEQKVITPVLKKTGRVTSLINDVNCTNCGRCVDICGTEVFQFDLRFNNIESKQALTAQYNSESISKLRNTNQSQKREVLS
jgi:polyferredoxin